MFYENIYNVLVCIINFIISWLNRQRYQIAEAYVTKPSKYFYIKLRHCNSFPSSHIILSTTQLFNAHIDQHYIYKFDLTKA